MRYKPGNPSLYQLVKLISIVIVLLFVTVEAYPQVKESKPIKRAGTIKTKKENGIYKETPVASDTIKIKQPGNKKVIRDIPTIDEGALKPVLSRQYPDTLQIGSYNIIIEAYDKGGDWNESTKTYTHLNGKGYIKFSCPYSYWNHPDRWKGAVIKPVSYKVVSNARVNDNEISTQDAAKLGIEAQPGSSIELMMPHINDKVIDIASFVKEAMNKKPEGVLVSFADISVKVKNMRDTKGDVVSGMARFPADKALKVLPVILNIYPGFQLEISDISFSPGRDPQVEAILLLPPSLSQKKECSRGRIDLGSIRIKPNCEFYKEYPTSDYGTFGVGNTSLAIKGVGYVVDFSSLQSHATSGKPAGWKGVILLQGESKGVTTGTVVSNTGYLQAPYSFNNGIIESTGLTASFSLSSPYIYNTTQPSGYKIEFGSASLEVALSHITGGRIQNGAITLPITAVRQANDNAVVLNDIGLDINSSLNVSGNAIIRPETCVYWGDLIKAGGGDRKSFGAANIARQVRIFFASEPRPSFNPTTPDGKTFYFPFNSITSDVIDSLNMQGATFGRFNVFIVNTPDRSGSPPWDPNKPEMLPTDNNVWYRFSGKENCWINVATEGVNCQINGTMVESPDLKLGDDNNPLYVGIKPFDVLTIYDKKNSSIILQCVESAVINCNYSSFVRLPMPTKKVMSFVEMVFTSTANNAGGNLIVGSNDSLSYWGLELVPKPGFNSAGLVSVKTGQIILTAAGLAERNHYTEPFWLTWGEILADGSVGRLFFDYNSAGQQFDHFNFIHDAVALSDYQPGVKSFLRVGGTAFFPFFAGDYLHIKDFYDTSRPNYPYNSRVIELSNTTLNGFSPSDLTIHGNWSDGLGIFDFDIKYNDVTQDGFIGDGTSELSYLVGGNLGSTLDMNSRGTCIRMGSDLMDQRSVSLGPIANVSNITRIWGCVCIRNNTIENVVVGGEVTNAANVSVAVRAGTHLAATLQITPALTRFTLDGEAYISIMLSLDAMVTGHMQLTLNHAENFVEGEVQGKIRVAEGAILIGSSLEAEGQLTWHLGLDFNELQGMVSLDVMGYGGGGGIGAGFYLGVNAPKSRAWVLLGCNPRYKLNMVPMPPNLTGVYGFVNVHEGVNWYIISGGYDLYLGFGAFFDPAPMVIGNLGGRIYGDILGGLVSAAAYFNLQFLLDSDFNRYCFQGTVGLEACVLWVICGSVDLTMGLNQVEGFYIR